MKTAMLCILMTVLVGVPGVGAAQDAVGTQPPNGLAQRVTLLESVVAQQANAIAALQAALAAERAARQSITFALQRNDVGEGTVRLALSDEVDLILVTLFQQGIAIPTFEQAQIALHEAAAIESLISIGTAENVFLENNHADYASSLSELSQFISSQLATGTSGGYNFAIASASQTAFTATACPVTPGILRSFFIDQTNVVRFSSTCPAGPADPPVQ